MNPLYEKYGVNLDHTS